MRVTNTSSISAATSAWSPDQWNGAVPSSPTFTLCVRRGPTSGEVPDVTVVAALGVTRRARDARAGVAMEQLVAGVGDAVAAEIDHERAGIGAEVGERCA